METIRFEAIEPSLRTGDLILFQGDSRRSRIVETISRSKFSHVGMVIRPDGKPPLLWHTDPRPVTTDLADAESHSGAQLNDLAAALRRMTSPEYGDTPCLRQLLVTRTPALDDAARRAIAAVDEKPFPSPLRVFRDWFLGKLHFATPGRRMDCAEIVAITYQRMGLLPPAPPANAYAPGDFSAEHENVRWLQGASLGPQRELV